MAPSFEAEARYRYDQTEVDPVSLVAGADGGWGSGLWGEATWAGASTPTQKVRGATGLGSTVAVAMRGVSIARTVLLGIDVTFTTGGFL